MTDGFFGWQGIPDDKSAFNAHALQIRMALLRARTATPVAVKAVHGGGVGAPPTVDVLPLVNMVDGVGNTTPHGLVVDIPVVRLQGGTAAIIIDPAVGDVGLLIVCDRDITSVKANKGAQSGPGSFDHHNLADGIFIGGILNPDAPKQYLQANSDGWKLLDKSGNSIVTNSSGINLNGVVIDSSGNIRAPGEVTAGSGTGDSVTLQQHVHTGNGVPPTPGT